MSRAVLCALYLCLSVLSRAQCLRMYGSVTDAYTGKGVPNVSIMQKMKGKLQVLSRTSATGSYRVEMPCDARELTIEAPGYRQRTLSLNLAGKPSDNGFYVPVKMVQIDKQASDQPYFQQQQQYVSLGEGVADIRQQATRVFEVVDAFSGKRVEAELCLFYTKTGVKDCRKLMAGRPGYEVIFTQTDIVAIEVRANGYQSYFGNLIVDKLDRKKSKYQIRLSSQLHLISVTVNAKGCTVSCRLSGAKPVVMASNGVHYWAEVPGKGDYQLEIKSANEELLHTATLSASEGLNLYALNLPAPKARTALQAKSASLSPEHIAIRPRTIYFDRSDYKLRPESKVVLDTLAAWLQSNPSGRLHITGHTDNVGNSKLNRSLSEYRARVTYHFMEQTGADPKRMTYNGKGGAFPVAPNDVETNKERNRRVEIELFTKP